jgi:hypothetical protein
MKERLNLTSFSQVGTYRKWMGFPIWKHRVGYFRLSLCRDLRWVGMELLEVPRWCWAKKERYKDLAGSWNLRELECVAAKPVAVKSRRRFSKYNSVEDFTAKYLYFSKQSPNYIWERYYKIWNKSIYIHFAKFILKIWYYEICPTCFSLTGKVKQSNLVIWWIYIFCINKWKICN